MHTQAESPPHIHTRTEVGHTRAHTSTYILRLTNTTAHKHAKHVHACEPTHTPAS